jgi:hypothetical protein
VLLLLFLPPLFIFIRLAILCRLFFKSFKKIELVFAITIIASAFIFYIGGHQNISGQGISFYYGFYLVALIALSSLLINSIRKDERIYYFNDIIFFYLALSFVYSILFYPEVLASRELVLLFHSSLGNSTNFINLNVLCCVLLYIGNKRRVIPYLVISLAFSILWQNRTGMILSSFLLIICRIDRKSVYLLFLTAVAIIFFIFEEYLISILPARLAVEGLESVRWVVQMEALQSMLSFGYPLGGFTPTIDIVPWLHNVILDTYRVVGFFPSFGLLTMILYGGWRNIIAGPSWIRRSIAWVVGTTIAMTSVVFEGHILEYIYFILIVFNFYFVPLRATIIEKIQDRNSTVESRSELI